MSMRESEELIKMAKLAEQFKRYEEMSAMMKQVIEEGVEVTSEIITMLSVSYKHIITDRRKSCCKIIAIEKETQESSRKHKLAMEYRKKIEAEQYEISNEVIVLLDRYLIPKVADVESKVFLFKMKADCSRYLADIATGDEKTTIKYYPGQIYKEAYEMARSSAKMAPTDPLRLAIARNWSEYYDSILENRGEALLLARQALNEAVMELHKVPRNAVQKTIDVMQVIWDNIVYWGKQANPGEPLKHQKADPEHGAPQPSGDK